MSDQILKTSSAVDADRWLKSYYLLRGAVSVAWVIAALTVGVKSSAVGSALLLVYPAWDAVANVVDARQNAGLRRNPTQAFNAMVSGVTTVAAAIALAMGMHAVFVVFGVWAAFSGLLQLATALRRRKRAGAQWLMVISGVQSAGAGAMFLKEANADVLPTIVGIAPYAAFGAFYFLVSGVWLMVSAARRRQVPIA